MYSRRPLPRRRNRIKVKTIFNRVTNHVTVVYGIIVQGVVQSGLGQSTLISLADLAQRLAKLKAMAADEETDDHTRFRNRLPIDPKIDDKVAFATNVSKTIIVRNGMVLHFWNSMPKTLLCF